MQAMLNNPQVLAALRNVLSAAGGVLLALGIGTLTPETVNKIMETIQALGVLATAGLTLVGVVAPIYSSLTAANKADPVNQVKAASAVANDPTNSSAPAVRAVLAQETAKTLNNDAVPVPGDKEARIAIINEVAKMPEVDKVVAPELSNDKRTESNVTSA